MKLLNSFRYAINGFIAASREGHNLRIHMVAGVIVVGLGFYYHVTPSEWSILLLLIGLVIGLELLNGAVENLTDLVTKEKSPLAGKVKDIAAAAVLFVSVIAVIIGIIIFTKYIIP